MIPNMDNGGRWHHIASEAETERAMRDKSAEVIEAPVIGATFIVSRRTLTTLRAGAMGGDVFSVEGGWVYANDIAQLLDRSELYRVADVATGRRYRS